ncbi:ATP-binding protein [Alkalibacter sp. M17DMB]|nr:ATP-binding protein [Alkalibacter mobilis]
MEYNVDNRDFVVAGDVSRIIKRTLQRIGVDPKIIRRIAIASYEAEMNIAIHSQGGKISAKIDSDKVVVCTQDYGPGIEDIALAMTEGWSTASAEIREMGFGAGMGLPNMKKCSDVFEIESIVPQGTKIKMTFWL